MRPGPTLGALGLLVACVARPALSRAAEPTPSRTSSAPAPATVQLDYERERAAASCVSAEQLARDVEARLGRRVFVAAGEAELVARLRARRVAGRFRIELELSDREGQSLGRRELSTRAAHCSALDDSLALVLALAADMPREPSRAAVAPDAPAAPEASPAVAPPGRPALGTPLSIPAKTHAPRLGARLRPSLGGAVAWGLVPGLSPGLELGLELRMNHFWPIRVGAAAFAERAEAARAPSQQARLAAQTLAIGVCPWTPALGAFEGALCAVQSLARIRARGVGFDDERREDGWVLHAGAGLSLSHELGPVFVAASATLLVPVVRRRYFITDGVDVTVYEQPWLAGLFGLRVGTEF